MQEAESAWAVLKGPIKNKRGSLKEDLEASLDERIWRQWRGLNKIKTNFLLALPSQYTDVTSQFSNMFYLTIWLFGLCLTKHFAQNSKIKKI